MPQHTLTSLLVLYPAVALLTVLVTRARSGLEDGSLRPEAAWVRTAAVFPVSHLSYVFLPLLGLCLALSLLLVRPFHRADRAEGEVLRGTIIV